MNRALTAIFVIALAATALSGSARAALLLHYEYDGDSLDQSGNSNDGVQSGGPAFVNDTPTAVSGRLTQSISMDGSNDFVAVENLNYGTGGGTSTLAALTVSVWFKTSAGLGNNNGFQNWAFLDYDRSEVFNAYIRSDNGALGFSTSDGSLVDQTGSTQNLNDGTWHHAAFVYDGTDMRIYLDGVLDGTLSNPHGGAALGTGNTRFGFSGDGSEAGSFNGSRNNIYYDGQMSDLAFWDEALSDIKILALAQGGNPQTIPEPSTYLVFTGLALCFGAASWWRKRRKAA